MTLVLLMALNISVALGLSFVLGRGQHRQAARDSENGREAVLDVKRQEGSVSARKRTRPDVHAATPLVARDFPR